MVSETDTAPDERTRVASWREFCLVEAGCSVAIAKELALGDVDLHQALDMLEDGCPPVLVARILRPLPR